MLEIQFLIFSSRGGNMFKKTYQTIVLGGGVILLLLLFSSSLFASTDSFKPAATQSYIVVPANLTVSDIKNSAEPGQAIQSFATEFAQSYEAKLITTYSTDFVGFVLDTDPETARRMNADKRIKHIHPVAQNKESLNLDEKMSWLLSDCPYDYCGHMTVTGFVIKVTVDTSGFVPTGLPYEREEVDTIDPFEELVQIGRASCRERVVISVRAEDAHRKHHERG